MAKVAKKTKVVKRSSAASHHSIEHQNFILIVGGGFIILAVMFLMTNGFGSWSMKSDYAKKIQASNVMEQNNPVMIKDAAFNPASITIKKGMKVTFENQDSIPHMIVSDDGSFETGTIAKGEMESVMFEKAGTYAYKSASDPLMMGTVIVEE